ncbi:hypothetical protein [Nostoc linckia]|uniref:hypothetical protein n=1 Tax=Nostoc linckia TaxID=92942 RepID=UPI00117CB7B0|nr:hypothetical protein [Nostoc linckia]
MFDKPRCRRSLFVGENDYELPGQISTIFCRSPFAAGMGLRKAQTTGRHRNKALVFAFSQ